MNRHRRGPEAFSRDLPQKQQEGLETVIGFAAVAMVTYMVLWMRKNARGMKGALEEGAASAIATGGARALVAMAFLAVLREGFETAVFLIATFQHSTNPLAGGIGASAGILVAIAIGWGIFEGGLELDLNRFAASPPSAWPWDWSPGPRPAARKRR